MEWPPHLLPVTLAITRLPPHQRRVLEARFACPPGVSAVDRPASVAMSGTAYHAALGSAKSFVEGYLSAAQERTRATG